MAPQTARLVPLTVDAAFARFTGHLIAANRDPQTIIWYREQLRRLSRFLAARGLPDDLRSLTADHLRDFSRYLQHEHVASRGHQERTEQPRLAEHTVASSVRGVKTVLRWLALERLLEMDPAAIVSVPSVRSEPRPAFSEDEIATLSRGPRRRHRHALRDKALVGFLIETGARISEARTLRVQDVDLEGRRARVVGKGARRRIVPLSDGLVAMLREYLTWSRPPAVLEADFASAGVNVPNWFFLSERGEQISLNGAEHMFRRYAADCGVERRGRSLHAIRRAFVNRWIMRQGDPWTLRLLLGHKRLDMVAQHYAALLPSDIDEKFRSLRMSALPSAVAPASPAVTAPAAPSTPAPGSLGEDGDRRSERRRRAQVRRRSRGVTRRARRRARGLTEQRSLAALSPRQRDVALRIVEGVPYREIAVRLGISHDTVKKHAEVVHKKLRVRSRVELMALLLRKPR